MFESNGKSEEANFNYMKGKALLKEVDLAGNEIGGAASLLYFRPWQFRTFEVNNQ